MNSIRLYEVAARLDNYELRSIQLKDGEIRCFGNPRVMHPSQAKSWPTYGYYRCRPTGLSDYPDVMREPVERIAVRD